MKHEDFIELVRNMRDAQKQYFSNPHVDRLKKAKTLEAQIDQAIRVMTGFDL